MQQVSKPQPVKSGALSAIIADPNVAIIDTREWEEYRKAHVRGALYIPINTATPMLMASFLEQSKDILAVTDQKDLPFLSYAATYTGFGGLKYFITPDQLENYLSDKPAITGIGQTSITDIANVPEDDESAILDVRTVDELDETGTIEGSYHIPLDELKQRHAELPPDEHIHVFCRTANRSKYAAGYLSKEGYRVTVLDGGIVLWQTHDLPVVYPSKNRRAIS